MERCGGEGSLQIACEGDGPNAQSVREILPRRLTAAYANAPAEQIVIYSSRF